MQLVKFKENGKWADQPGLPQVTVKAGQVYSVSDFITHNVIKSGRGTIVGKIPDKVPEKKPEIKENDDIGPVLMSNKETNIGPFEKAEKPEKAKGRWKRKKK